MKHTPAPWTIEKHTEINKRFHIPEPDIWVNYDDVNHKLQDANARRIIVCIKACEGILTSELARMKLGNLHRVFEEYKTKH